MTKSMLACRSAVFALALMIAPAPSARPLDGGGPQKLPEAAEQERAQRALDEEAVRKMPDPGYDFAVVTKQDAAIRARADFSSPVLRQLKRSEMLALVDRNPNGIWYSVIHIDSATEGWVRQDEVVVRFSATRREGPAIRAERTEANGHPSIVITNDADTELNLSIADDQYSIPGRAKRMVVLRPGKYKFHAYRPGGKPIFGEHDFEPGYSYRWIFWTEKREVR